MTGGVWLTIIGGVIIVLLIVQDMVKEKLKKEKDE